MSIFIHLVAGVVFGFGLVISGMANPAKVLNFLDVLGTWDPSLACVMGGAVLVAMVGYRWAFGRGKPVLSDTFRLPSQRKLDVRILVGPALFGLGWGLAGFCPGPALTSLGLGKTATFLFVGAMLVGMMAARSLADGSERRRVARRSHLHTA